MTSAVRRSLLLAAALGIAACSVTNPFTTAGSLRVEVEVYKGPLSKEPAVQWGELTGLVDEASVSLGSVSDGIMIAAANTGALAGPTDVCKGDRPALKLQPHYRADDPKGATPPHTRAIGKGCPDGSMADHDKFKFWCASPGMQGSLHSLLPSDFSGCTILAHLHDDAFTAQKQIFDIQKNVLTLKPDATTPLKIQNMLQDISKFGVQMKAKAFYWAESHAALAPRDRIVRNVMTNFANWASEYSNQLGSRADALLKQMKPAPADRRELPLSVLLRDTTPTDFVNLYVWNRAAAPAILEEMILHPIDAFRSEETADRVRVVERLFSDHNWSKINTVYASGEGKTSIALIKDDIGNWNLKSFDTDPTELLDAYKQMTLAGIKAATSAITAGITGGGPAALQSALKTASSLTRGKIASGDEVGGLNIDAMHKRTHDRLAKLKVDQESRLAKIESEIAKKNDAIGAVDKTDISDEDKNKKKDKLKAEKTELEVMKDEVPSKTVQGAKRIIEDHEFLINTLEQSVVSPEMTGSSGIAGAAAVLPAQTVAPVSPGDY